MYGKNLEQKHSVVSEPVAERKRKRYVYVPHPRDFQWLLSSALFAHQHLCHLCQPLKYSVVLKSNDANYLVHVNNCVCLIANILCILQTFSKGDLK